MLEALGSRKALTDDIRKLEKEKVRLAANIGEMEKAVAVLQGQHEAIKNTVSSLLKSVITDIGTAYRDSVKKLLDLYPYRSQPSLYEPQPYDPKSRPL